ncbi:MAG: U32 family peptidase, partial [Erysipelotrichales bacterium]
MKSKILAEITSIEQGLTFIEKGIDALLINVMGVSVTKEFNCYTDELSIITQKAQEKGVEILLNLDMLYHQEDLLGLRAMLKRLSKYDIIALIISDVAILELVKELELDIKCISGINTLNTNYHTMNSMNKIFNGYFISNEINISEVMNIVKNVESSLVVQVYGKQKMFYSKRQLLS